MACLFLILFCELNDTRYAEEAISLLVPSETKIYKRLLH